MGARTVLLALCAAALSHADSIDVTAVLTQLAKADANRAGPLDVIYDYQNQASHTHFDHDNAKNPLFKYVDDDFVNSHPTYAGLLQISEAFIRDASVADPVTSSRKALWESWTRALNATAVFQSGWNALVQAGLAPAKYDDFEKLLYKMWLTPFARKTAAGSSGLETVFVGEFLDDDVVGLNSWLRFYELEKKNVLDYHGWFERQEDVQLSLQFGLLDKDGIKKAMISPLLLDSSPEFDLIAYTICALAGKGACALTIDEKLVHLVVKTRSVDGVTLIDNAYPTINGDAPVTSKPGGGGDLQKLVDSMWSADTDKAGSNQYKVVWGDHIPTFCDDKHKLIDSVDESLFSKAVYAVLATIYDNNMLKPDVCINETDYRTGFKKTAFQAVLDTWAKSPVFPLMHKYLVDEGKADADVEKFKEYLYQFWFGPYSRCTLDKHQLGSSGFEHVFSGEWKKGEVDGQHNWFKYYREQKAGKIEYCGYFHYDGQLTGTFKYNWDDNKKNEGGFLIGTSPVFDFSLLTTCALAHSGAKKCRFTIEKYDLAVTSYTQACANGGTCLATAYPVDEL